MTVSSTKGVASDSIYTSIRANNTNKVINIRYNAQAHDQLYNVMFMLALCGQFHLKGVYCI